MMRFFTSISIRARLVLLVALAALPALGVIVTTGFEAREEAVRGARSEIMSVSGAAAALLERMAESTRLLLATLAVDPEIASKDAKEANKHLARVLEKTKGYSNLLAAGPDGEVFASALPFTAINSADRKHFKDAVASGDFAAGEYIVSRSTHGPGFPFAYPVYDAAGKLTMVLMATLDLSQFSQVFDAAMMPEGSMMALIDAAGVRLFYHPADDASMPLGKPIRAENFASYVKAKGPEIRTLPGSDGRERIYASRQIRLAPDGPAYAYLTVGVLSRAVLARADAITFRNMVLLGCVSLLALGLAFFLGDAFIRNGIVALRDFAVRLRAGELSARIDEAQGPEEVRRLAGDLNAMAATLAASFAKAEAAGKALAESESKLRTIADFTYDWEFWRSPDGSLLWVSPSCERLTGYAASEFMARPELIEEIVHPEDTAFHDAHMEDITGENRGEHNIDFRIINRQGKVVWLNHRCQEIFSPSGVSLGRRVSNADITARKHAEQELVLAARIFEDSIQGVVITGRDGRILRVNPSFTEITGYAACEAIGNTPSLLKSDRHPAEFYREMWAALTAQGQWTGEIWNRRKSGEIYPEWLNISSVRDENGEIINYIAIFHDITEVKRHQEALRHQAEHDALTGLPNRFLFNDRLVNALSHAKRRKHKVAVIFIDLDRFKHVNDSLGHSMGDELLIEVARRLKKAVREEDTVARLGGDEFILLLSAIDSPEDAAMIARRVTELLADPVKLGEIEFSATASIGIAVYPDDGSSADEVVKNADLAMYKAKNLGRNNFQFFTPEMEAKARERLALELQMQRGLRNGEFEVFYQPLTDLKTGGIIGAEALVRWRREGALVAPGEFISLAEETGLIVPLGEWVLEKACVQAQKWRTDIEPEFKLGVNISTRQFASSDLPEVVSRSIESSGLPPGALHLEITESSLLGNEAAVAEQLFSLKRAGAKFYLDDFGTGYSSLSYLKRLPIDGLKIDRSFVSGVGFDPDSRVITAAIVSLAKSLGLSVVAEGVEDLEQLRFLSHLDAGVIQGYFVSKPVSAAVFEQMLRQGGNRFLALDVSARK